MQYARSFDGRRIQAARGVEAVCPICDSVVVAKCGRIVVHHWAHASGCDCDAWFEPESEWHRGWKALFAADQVEVPMGEHRADVRVNGIVVELQSSSISPEEIGAREHYYQRMAWVVNAEPFADRFFLMRAMGNQVLSFKWKSKKAIWGFAKRPVYFDFGERDVRSLRGVKELDREEVLTPSGLADSYKLTKIVHHHRVAETRRESYRYEIDASLHALDDGALACTMLKLVSLHANGFGSVIPVRRAEFLRSLGIG